MGFRFCRMAANLLLAIVVVGGLIVPAHSDEPDRVALQRQKDQLFQQMLANPANLDVVFAYANVSAQLGDNEAAVSALEQMLLFNPNLPRVDLELGALYFRMGSFDVARTYFEKAEVSHPPPEVQQRIDEYLALIARQTASTGLTGYVFFGAQYQSDANVAPGSSTIVSPVGPVLLTNQFVKQSDFDVFTNGSALYTYDLGNQYRDTLEIGGQALVNHYMKVGRLDLDFAEVTAGPRLRYPQLDNDIVHDLTIKPYAILNEVGLGEHQYFDTYGAGFETTGVVWHDLALRAAFEFRQKTFDNAPDRPLSSGLSGNDKLVAFQAVKPITSNSALTLELDYVDQLTKLRYYANQSYAAAATYHIHYQGVPGLPGVLDYPMETSVYASRLYSVYFAPDPCCIVGGGFSTRDDRRWKFGIIQGVQVTDSIELIAQFERDIVSSNLPLYGYTSNSVVIGPQIKFNATPPAPDAGGLSSPGQTAPPSTAAPAVSAVAFRLEGSVGGVFGFDSAKASLTTPALSASSTLTGNGVAAGAALWADGPLALWTGNPAFRNVSLGVEFRHSNNSDSSSVTASVPAFGGFPGGSISGTAVGNLDTESALVNAAWRWNDGALHPYAGVGGGVSVINWTATLNAPTLSSSVTAGLVAPVAAGHVFAGLDYDITPRVYVGTGADFFFTDTASKSFTHSQVQLSADQVSLVAHAGFRF